MGILDKIKKPKKTTESAVSQVAQAPASEKKPRAAKVVETTETASGNARRGSAYRVLIQAVVSEKAALAETKGMYTFVVAVKASKEEIKAAVERVYGVRPTKVKTMNVEGKEVRFGRTIGRRKDWKKAIVTLAKGKTISIHEGV